jgi:serine/threonine protein kinase
VGTWIRGKYLLERELGSGGMAVVYAARHRNKKRFAVKVLHPELARHPEVQARFQREGYVANSVEHPGAVSVLDDDVTEDGSAFLVMELLDGKTIEQLAQTRGGQLSLEAVLAIAHQTLEVLTAAHAKNVVHRDIKPGNLFLTREGQVKVLDFGIARLHEANSSSATQAGVSLGTPAFMAPEQALGKIGFVGARSDLWSVGATMFALLTGRDVHEGETPQHMMVLAATARAPSVSTLSRSMPAAAAALIDRALAFDPADRWASAREMDEAVCALYAALFGAPISRGPLAELASQSISPPSMAEASHPTMMSPGAPAPPAGDTTVASTPVFGDADARSVGSSHVSIESDGGGYAIRPHVGRTTEQPVSDGMSERASEPSRNMLLLAVGGLVVVLGIAAVALLRPGSRTLTPADVVATQPSSSTREVEGAPGATAPVAAGAPLVVDVPEPPTTYQPAPSSSAPGVPRAPVMAGHPSGWPTRPGATTRPGAHEPSRPPDTANASTHTTATPATGAAGDFDRQ